MTTKKSKSASPELLEFGVPSPLLSAIGSSHSLLNGSNGSSSSSNTGVGAGSTGSYVDDADIFSWMFMNPELFPTRSFLPGINSSTEELSLPSPPISPSLMMTQVKQEKDDQFMEQRRSSFEDEDDDEDDDDEDEDDSSFEDSDKRSTSTKGKDDPLSTNQHRASSSSASNAKRAGANKRKSNNTKSTNSNHNNGSSTPTNGMDDDPRLKRLEKNREIARNCRKRKREKMAALEEEVQKLRDWNRQLELKLKQIPENSAKELVRQREVQEIASLVSDDTAEPEIRKKLHQYKEVYSDFGRDRKQAITFHLEQLKSLLLPNQVSKMTIWSLQQEDDFYDEQRNKTTFGGGIWNLLCEELRLTEEQKRTLLGMRNEIRGQRKNVGECLRIVKELEKRIGENITSMGKQMAKIMSVTTPIQQARFLLWIEHNRAAVQVLNNIWEKKERRRRIADQQ
jgi:hypothetical protein